MQLSRIESRVHSYLGSARKYATRQDMKDWINEADMILVSELRLEEQERDVPLTTVAGTREYLVPLTGNSKPFNVIKVVYDNTGTAGTLAPKRWSELDLDTAVIGRPEAYYLRGGMIGFSPIPEEAVTVKIYLLGLPNLLVTDTDEPAASDWLIPVLIKYCVWQGKLKEFYQTGDQLALTAADGAERIFRQELNRVKESYHYHNSPRELTIGTGARPLWS
ncbi:MAG: hypothetical protein HQK57_08540 [Deltaproteobacteria bacterium]|nr:hypothetical protein [Deltaproteobacteria bacterium]MBF0524665.1 hypothetical protein [Deltaproteobacteria bacterium]